MDSCEKLRKHKAFSRCHDSFVCYQKLEDNIIIAKENLTRFERDQEKRENLLREMLNEFNEGRSKSYYCIASTICEIEDLERIIDTAKTQSIGLGIKEKCKILHRLLSELAQEKGLLLKLRK